MRLTFWLGALLLVVGCGAPARTDGGTPDSGLPDSGADDSGTTDAGPADAGASDGGQPAVGIPTLMSVTEVVHGTHQLTWRLPASGCSYVSLSLRFGTTSYGEVWVVPGSDTTTQYVAGHTPGNYCYTLNCTLNSLISGASNELCIAHL